MSTWCGAGGRSAEELLDNLTERLDNDAETERRVVAHRADEDQPATPERLSKEEGAMTQIGTHVLDATSGMPAAGVPVTLTGADGAATAEGVTDDDGRIGDLYTGELSGVCRLRFDTASYFAAHGSPASIPKSSSPSKSVGQQPDTTCRCCCLRTPIRPTEGAERVGHHPGKTQYGKAENRVVRIYRDSPRHEIRDINVSTCLRGDFSAAYLAGDQSDVLPTDTQKQTVYAYAKEKGLTSIENYGLELARHFVHDVGPVQAARIEVDEFAWQRVVVDGVEHDHTGSAKGEEVRTAAITVDGDSEWVVGGLKDLVILKSTGSEFAGFLTDPYTVLEPTPDRVMATSPGGTVAVQQPAGEWSVDWDGVYAGVKNELVKQFAVVHSLALQQTLYEMGKGRAGAIPGDRGGAAVGAEQASTSATTCRDLAWKTTNEVFNADDRPYGLIQATVTRDDATAMGPRGTVSSDGCAELPARPAC